MDPSLAGPWSSPGARGPRVRLVRVPLPVMRLLVAGGEGVAEREGLTPFVASEECVVAWRMRIGQIEASPAEAAWVTRLIYADGVEGPVGIAGFHGPPDARGMVEAGYHVDPGHRRRGYARAALEAMLAVARARPEVRVVRATIAPANPVSQRIVRSAGFAVTGEQWDEADGLEIVWELDVV